MILRDDITADLVQSMGGDHAVLASMMVSTQADESLGMLEQEPEASKGRIEFLMGNRHGTPFEHNAMTFFIEAPIAVFREFHRHRIGWSYNEESGRYKQLRPIFYVPARDRALVQVGKAGAYEFVAGDDAQYELMKTNLQSSYAMAYANYQEMLDANIAKEIARGCLPVFTYSSMYATCNARSLMAFLSLRTKREGSTFPSFPQREIEMVAERMEEQFAELFPVTYAAFNKFGRVCP